MCNKFGRVSFVGCNGLTTWFPFCALSARLPHLAALSVDSYAMWRCRSGVV
jgi:hypothetical protein